MRSTFLALTLLVACLSSVSGQVPNPSAESKAMVKKVFAAWKERREQFKSVRYKASGTILVPKGSIVLGPEVGGSGQPEPKEDLSLPCEIGLLIDFEGKRHRIDKKQQVYSTLTNGALDRISQSAHDGKELWWSWPRGGKDRGPEDPDASILSGNLREAAFSSAEWPYFIAHGIVPAPGASIVPGRLAPKLDERKFYSHAIAVHEGRECVVLRTDNDHFTGKSFNEYWVDMDRGGQVLRLITYRGNEPARNVDLRYQTAPTGWMLSSWLVTVRSGTRTTQLHEMTVDSCESNPAFTDKDFQLVLTPGMKVDKVLRGGNEDSIGPAPTVSDQQFVVDAHGRLAQTGGTTVPSGGYFWWIVAGCSVLFLILMVVWFRRRRSAA